MLREIQITMTATIKGEQYGRTAVVDSGNTAEVDRVVLMLLRGLEIAEMAAGERQPDDGRKVVDLFKVGWQRTEARHAA